MNTIGIYARYYFDALNAAFAPFIQLSSATNHNKHAPCASQHDRAHAETGLLVH